MDADTLNEIKQKILGGEMSLRAIAEKYNIDRDTLKGMIQNSMSNSEEARCFRERMKLNRGNARLELDDTIEEMVIFILRGEITAKQASDIYHMDRETIRRKIAEFVQKDNRYLKLYMDYCSKSGNDYGRINFKGLIVYMLKHGMSQSEIATEYGISARTISREIEKIGQSRDQKDQQLYNIAKICADKSMKRQRLSVYESELYTRILDGLFPNLPIIDFENGGFLEKEKRKLQDFCEQVEEYKSQGMTATQIAHKMNSSISTIRRKRLRLDELKRQEQYQKKLQSEEIEDPEI